MKIGDTLVFSIYGHDALCEVLVIHSMNTVDVMRIEDGKCFRVSGLKANQEKEG